MKLTKLFGLLGMACVLTLAACGGQSSKTPGGDDEEEESEYEPEEDEPGISYSSLSVLKENNKVYIQLDGSVDDGVVTGNSMKAAFGVTDGEEFIVGKEEPENADYNITVPLADGEFSAKVEMPATGLKAGQFQVFFGPKDYYARANGSVGDGVVNDDNFTFYFRSDNGVNSAATLCLDAMPPVRIQDATIELNVAGHAGGIFAKIGGAKKGSLDQATLDSYDTFIDFQKLPNTTTSVAKYEAGMEAEENPDPYYFWKVEGDNAFIYVRINFMVAENATSGSYNTHLNVTEKKQQNCRTEGDVAHEGVVVNAYGDTIAVSSHPNGGHTESNIWANLGFVTEIQERPSAEVEESSDNVA